MDAHYGQTSSDSGCVYTFRLPDGRERRGFHTGQGRLRSDLRDLAHSIAVEVEYDPVDPSISCIKGDGSQNLVEWLLRKVVLGGVLLILFVSPGVMVIRDGVRTFRADSTKLASEGDA